MYLAAFLACTLLSSALTAEIPVKPTSDPDRNDFKRSFEKECATAYSTTCLKLDIVQWVEKLSDHKDISVLPGVTIVKENDIQQEKNNVMVAKLAREFPDDPDSRLNAYVMKKITGFLGSHSIKLNLFDPKDVEQAVVTGRKEGGFGGGGGGKGGKKGGGMGMIMAMGAMMKGMMMTLAMGGIAALAGKALMTGMIALMLSAIIGLKSLTSKGHSTTYEVVAKPIHTSHHSHSFSHEEVGGHGHGGHGGYGRSFTELPKGLQPDYKPY